MESSRRDFLKVSALGVAANMAGAVPVFPQTAATSPNPSAISVWVTDEKSRYAPATGLSWKPAGGDPAAETITLHPENRFQPMLGFGAAFTDAACYTINQLAAGPRKQLLHELFSPAEMGFNVCRTCIGASDYSTKVYSYDEGDPDPDLTRFSIDHDREYIIPTLRAARAVNPDLFLFSTPWSPPGWMKPNNSMLGGSMRRKYMPSYGNYFVRFLEDYAAAGVPIQAVSIQNEVDTEQDGRMPACTWPQEYEADFVRKNLGPAFQAKGLNTKIWLIDHNYNLWGRALGELETPEVRQYSNAIAWHGYVGQVEWIDRVHEKYPDVEMYWTEGGPDYVDPHFMDNWSLWSATFTGILRHWCRSITAWNFALDELGKPNLGPFPCGGLVTVHSQTKEITRCGQYWAFAHYSKNIGRGARRFDTQSLSTEVQHVAFENLDGRRVLILTNQSAAKMVSLRLQNMAAEVSLSANSVTTLVWQ
jgi:glucosylceramidase